MERIEALYHDTSGKCYVSFSGGKDSTVILALIKMCEEIYTLPPDAIPAGILKHRPSSSPHIDLVIFP